MNQIFNETEKTAVATVIFKLIAADKKYDKNELKYMHSLYLNYDIPLVIPTEDRIGYQKAVECIHSMDNKKKDIIRNILNGLASCDSTLDEEEKRTIEQILL